MSSSDRPPSTAPAAGSVALRVNGVDVEVSDPTLTLLDVVRDQLGHLDVKDGCAPQGQCGCCTVLVDGAPRVACVTPIRRVRGRSVTTPAAIDDAEQWAEALCATGGTQCGFCTPGIIARLAGLRQRKPDATQADVEQALLAHLCRCTGWQTVVEAWSRYGSRPVSRDLVAAERRAELESGGHQRVAPSVALGEGGFAADTTPPGTPVALLDRAGAWMLAESVAAARRATGAVQGRRTTEDQPPPVPLPEGDWDVVLQTSWAEPGYLETDSSWCEPGGEPADPVANGGAFGGKAQSATTQAARDLAAASGAPVRAAYRREDATRFGPKRPPLAAGLRRDGTGMVHVARTPGIAAAIAAVLPDVDVVEVDVPGPPTSTAIRGAGWAEAVALRAAISRSLEPVTQPGGGTASARIDDDGAIHVHVDAGDPLDPVVLRSYCIGAAHQAASLVTAESLAVDADGEVLDLTIRSFGILRPTESPRVEVDIAPSAKPAVPVSDAVFAAVAAAVWVGQGTPQNWPTGMAVRS